MVDCPRDDIRDLLPDLVHDQLEPAERARVEEHLVNCERCASELELLRSLRATAFSTPTLDVDRVAEAVRSSMAPSVAESDSADVVPISEARRRIIGSATGAGTRKASRRESRPASPRPVGRGVAQRGRIAAAITLVAAGAGGYALISGRGTPLPHPARQATVASSEPVASGASAAAPMRSEAKASAPAPAAPSVAMDLAGAADSGVESGTAAPGPLILGDALNELSESDMQALLQSVDDLEAMPDLEPHQLPLIASVVEGAL
jgi:anti-sigma factor RsiW